MRKHLACLLLFAASSFAAEQDMRAILASVIKATSDTELPSTEELTATANEAAVWELKPSEAISLIPLAGQCLQSTRIEVQRRGLLFSLAMSFRPDSSSLFAPLDPRLEALAENVKSPLRTLALYVLSSTNPSPPKDVVAYLSTHLRDSSYLPEQQRVVAVSLVQASAANPGLLKNVLEYLRHNDQASVSAGVLSQIAVSGIQDADALSYISESLSNDNKEVRYNSIRCIEKLDPSLRIEFMDQLRKIAANPEESQENRNSAQALIR